MPEAIGLECQDTFLHKRNKIISSVQCELPEGYQLREVEENDFEKGTRRTEFYVYV